MTFYKFTISEVALSIAEIIHLNCGHIDRYIGICYRLLNDTFGIDVV